MKTVWRIASDAVLRFAADDGWAIASHLALSFLMSLFPFLIFVTALAGFFGSQDLANTAAQLLLETWPERVAAPIGTEIHNVLTQPHSGILTIGAVLALYFASSGVEALRVGLNRAYEDMDQRPWWMLRLESIFYVLVASFAFLALAFLVVLAPLIWTVLVGYFPGLRPLEGVVTLARFAAAATILIVALLIVHVYLPASRRSIADVAIGVLLTLVLWVGGGVIFGSYLSEYARNYVNTYAGLASVMIALVFLYMVGAIFLFGGELNAAILRARDARRKAVR